MLFKLFFINLVFYSCFIIYHNFSIIYNFIQKELFANVVIISMNLRRYFLFNRKKANQFKITMNFMILFLH